MNPRTEAAREALGSAIAGVGPLTLQGAMVEFENAVRDEERSSVFLEIARSAFWSGIKYLPCTCTVEAIGQCFERTQDPNCLRHSVKI